MATKLVNMIEEKDEQASEPCYGEKSGPAYPYGLQINLCDKDLTKLEVSDLPEVSEEMTLTAKVKVISTADSQGFYSRNRSLGLQITDMALGEIGKESDEKY